MNKWDYHTFFDSVNNVLLDQKYIHGLSCQAINEEPEVDLDKYDEIEPSSANNTRFTIRQDSFFYNIFRKFKIMATIYICLIYPYFAHNGFPRVSSR